MFPAQIKSATYSVTFKLLVFLLLLFDYFFNGRCVLWKKPPPTMTITARKYNLKVQYWKCPSLEATLPSSSHPMSYFRNNNFNTNSHFHSHLIWYFKGKTWTHHSVVVDIKIPQPRLFMPRSQHRHTPHTSSETITECHPASICLQLHSAGQAVLVNWYKLQRKKSETAELEQLMTQTTVTTMMTTCLQFNAKKRK
jgi:hypothetical protein